MWRTAGQAVLASLIALSSILAGRTLTLASRPFSTSCALASSTYLSPRIWGAFTRIHTETDHTSPFWSFIIPTGHPSFLVSDFQVERMQAFVSNLVLHGRYRAENNAYARSLGYKPGKDPVVPLVGTIVKDHPDVLEVYEFHWVWRSSRGAAAQMRSVRGSGKGDHVVRQTNLHLGSDSLGYVTRPVVSDGLHEWSVGIVVRLHALVVTLTLRGGARVASANLPVLGREVLNRMGSCHA
jgi:hypothetical protein